MQAFAQQQAYMAPIARAREMEHSDEGLLSRMQRAAPSEQAIQSLVDMGFERSAAMGALAQTNNDVDAAANLLLQ